MLKMWSLSLSTLLLFVSLLGHGFAFPFKDENPQEGFTKLTHFPSAVKQGEPLEWWQETVVYQVYPRSFQDSDGNGMGDIRGIIQRADYFKELGVNAIWISPIYKSPMVDFGYDISNFTDIDPIFGTLEDFKELSVALKERDIRIVMDFVPNHSSDQHPWFEKSVNREGKYADYYVWKDPKGHDQQGKPIPPNNWTSVFGGSMWEWNEKRGQFYLHQFVKEQPDLNFENRDVWIEILAAVKFWLDMGVDGFRVDAVPHLFEDQRFLDEPVNPNRDPNTKEDEYHYYTHIYTSNLPRALDLLAQMRQLLDVYTGDDLKVRCMMVEAAVATETLGNYYGDHNRPIAHFPFNFNLLSMRPDFDAETVESIANIWFNLVPNKWANSLVGNHDNRRMPTRFTPEGIDTANMINLLIQGTAITYNGEEIGMEDQWISWDDTVDPAGCNMGPERYEQFSRDPARTPFQWDDTKNAGFSNATKTWLPMHEKHLEVNVKLQNAAEESHLKVYKELIKLRKRDVWKYGNYTSFVLNDKKVFGFIRTAAPTVDDLSYIVLANVQNTTQIVDISTISGIPATAKVAIRSVDFENRGTTIGSDIPTNNIPLGNRNSIVLTFPST